MTTAARLVLEDCRGALAAMQNKLPPSEWRRNLASLLTLLRATGHVLDKVDGARDEKLGATIKQWWKKVNHERHLHPLFWEFIELERNSFIKQYETAARQTMVGYVGAVNYNIKTGEYTSDPYRPFEYQQQMRIGHYAGQDLMDVANEAIVLVGEATCRY